MAKKPEIMSALCPVCKRRNKHQVLRKFEVSIRNDEIDDYRWDKHEIIQCCGCENVSFQHTYAYSDFVDEDGDPVVTHAFYPSPHIREPIAQHYFLPTKVRRGYKELLIALSNGATLLGAIGLRLVVEGICEDKKCTARNLELKIEKLVQTGALSSDQADFLHLQRFMGNDAAHEIQAPDDEELEAALSIVENLLTTLYVLPQTAANMEKSQAQLAKRKARVLKPNAI